VIVTRFTEGVFSAEVPLTRNRHLKTAAVLAAGAALGYLAAAGHLNPFSQAGATPQPAEVTHTKPAEPGPAAPGCCDGLDKGQLLALAAHNQSVEAKSAQTGKKPTAERFFVQAGIILIKFWLEVGQEEQRRRFTARIEDPMRQWKLSAMDLESYARWYAYSRARDMMLEATDTEDAPWYIVRSDDKRRARLNCIAHLLRLIPYKEVAREKVKLPRRSDKGEYDDQATLEGRTFVPERY
jgi:Polyphosphate kinase 2 (PPK2)